MSNFKPKLRMVPIAVALATGGILAGCFNNGDSTTATPVVKDDAYYKNLAENMLKNLSLSEKLDIVSGPGIDFSTMTPYPTINLSSEHGPAVGYINGVKNSSLDIPAVTLDDGPAGLKVVATTAGSSGTTYATAWPIGSLLASTWDVDLVNQVGKAMGEEVKEYGTDFLLTPGMNIQRNPLTGRNFEYFSEDPLVTGKIGAALVNGLQSNNVGATIKHYFGNEAETNRSYVDDIGEPRTFREIYMRGFQIAVDESQPWAVMSPYNKVNGSYVSHRKDAITNILRDEWEFNGLVMSDWFAGDVFADSESAANMMKAGNDLIQPGGVKNNLQASIDAGTLSESDVDKNVVHILTQVQKTSSYNKYQYTKNPDLNSHAVLSRKAGEEGMILLKNNTSTLPLSTDKKVASFGVGQLATYKGGTGSGNVFAQYVINIATGLSSKFMLDTAVSDYYKSYYDSNKVAHYDDWGPLSYYSYTEPAVTGNAELTSALTSSAENDDVAVITISRQAGEGTDRTNSKGDYLLSDNEMDMLTSVANAFHAKDKKVVVVLNVAGVVDTTQWSDKVDGILLAYMGGQETGYEVSDILSGDVNPSGKLTQTFPAAYSDVPSSTTFPGVDANGTLSTPDSTGKYSPTPVSNFYNEGIYVGYRYYNTFDKKVSYPFGYGLSYTSFGYSDVAVSNNTLDKGALGSIIFSATITNTGSVAGKEVAQVYINAPEVKLKKPTIELKAFAKTTLLDSGASEKLTFNIPAKILASFDPANNQWIVEPGQYTAYISSSSDVTNATPVTFNVSKEIVVSNTTPGALALPAGVDASTVTIVTKQ